jgi:hypothetical protein
MAQRQGWSLLFIHSGRNFDPQFDCFDLILGNYVMSWIQKGRRSRDAQGNHLDVLLGIARYAQVRKCPWLQVEDMDEVWALSPSEIVQDAKTLAPKWLSRISRPCGSCDRHYGSHSEPDNANRLVELPSSIPQGLKDCHGMLPLPDIDHNAVPDCTTCHLDRIGSFLPDQQRRLRNTLDLSSAVNMKTTVLPSHHRTL